MTKRRQRHTGGDARARTHRDSEELSDGLVAFFSSQAEVMLAQFENINHLLGETTDWTHPGTLCEELLKDYLRRTLVAGMSADKGYVYGRAVIEGRSRHSPEIDVLIHHKQRFNPIFGWVT